MDGLIDALVPDMPQTARAAIAGQAEGIPLFAVETVRSLVDRDIVVPRDGVYRLVGDLGALSVPDGLRALLAARLDALDPDLRSLVAEAAVLGSTFSADSLVAVSAQDEESVRSGLAELLRREVLSITADRLSPKTCCGRWPTTPCRGATARPDISSWPLTCGLCLGPTATRWPR
jgi:predicted ATPase